MEDKIQYTKAEERLLRDINRTDKWYYRSPLIYSLFLIPVIFTVGNIALWLWITSHFQFCIAAIIDGEVCKVDFNFQACAVGIICLFGLYIAVGVWFIINNITEYKTFKQIYDKMKIHNKADSTES